MDSEALARVIVVGLWHYPQRGMICQWSAWELSEVHEGTRHAQICRFGWRWMRGDGSWVGEAIEVTNEWRETRRITAGRSLVAG